MAAFQETEKGFQSAVIQLAKLYGWRVYHTFDSRHSAKGFPDLTLVRGVRCIMAELKTDIGRVSPDQKDWLRELSEVPGIEAALWRPRDWPILEATLTRTQKKKRPAQSKPSVPKKGVLNYADYERSFGFQSRGFPSRHP